MPKYVDAEKIEKTLWDSLRGYRHVKEKCAVKNCILEIEEAPAADVAEVKHGSWIDINTTLMCSECGIIRAKNTTGVYNYCPNCGAKMDGERSETK